MSRQLRQMALEKFGEHETMALAAADKEGNVDCAPVFFAFDEECRLYFSTASTSQKAGFLAKNAKVSVCMDDAKQSGVQLHGRATRLFGKEADAAKAMLLERHPKVARWFENPNLQFFRITPEDCFVINFAWGSDWRVPVPL